MKLSLSCLSVFHSLYPVQLFCSIFVDRRHGIMVCWSSDGEAHRRLLRLLERSSQMTKKDEGGAAKTVIKHILQSLKKRKCNLESLDALQTTLQSKVMSKKFLPVMDDIWEEDKIEWENVLAPLRYGSSGSKILITTRMESIALMLSKIIEKSKEILPLKGSEKRELLKIFKKHAFVGVENPNDTFKLIAEKMVDKLLECPLAAVVIGKTLNFNLDECYWKNVLNSDIGSRKTIESFFLSDLNLSYIYLPNYLKKCFTFCCIFPRQHGFDKDDLVRMWIALDFVQSLDI